jgi:hypothetical protein
MLIGEHRTLSGGAVSELPTLHSHSKSLKLFVFTEANNLEAVIHHVKAIERGTLEIKINH